MFSYLLLETNIATTAITEYLYTDRTHFKWQFYNTICILKCQKLLFIYSAILLLSFMALWESSAMVGQPIIKFYGPCYIDLYLEKHNFEIRFISYKIDNCFHKISIYRHTTTVSYLELNISTESKHDTLMSQVSNQAFIYDLQWKIRSNEKWNENVTLEKKFNCHGINSKKIGSWSSKYNDSISSSRLKFKKNCSEAKISVQEFAINDNYFESAYKKIIF